MQVKDFEDGVWNCEGIRIVVRAAQDQTVNDYDKNNAAPASWSVSEWLKKRVVPCLNGIDAVVIAGDGQEPHGKILIKKIRQSYGNEPG